jgi:hypothetical protein
MALHPAPNVISQLIDGEAVVINLDDGCYYTFNGPGSDVWAGAEAGSDTDQLARLLHERYKVDVEAAADTVSAFVQALGDERLVVEDLQPGEPVVTELAPPAPFEQPRWHKFEDMKDLILLDPVHEVDEQQGWPHRREDAVTSDVSA